MQLKVIDIRHKHHVTAHDRRAIIAGIEAGYKCFKTPRKTFSVISLSPSEIAIERVTRERDVLGRMAIYRETYFVDIEATQCNS